MVRVPRHHYLDPARLSLHQQPSHWKPDGWSPLLSQQEKYHSHESTCRWMWYLSFSHATCPWRPSKACDCCIHKTRHTLLFHPQGTSVLAFTPKLQCLQVTMLVDMQYSDLSITGNDALWIAISAACSCDTEYAHWAICWQLRVNGWVGEKAVASVSEVVPPQSSSWVLTPRLCFLFSWYRVVWGWGYACEYQSQNFWMMSVCCWVGNEGIRPWQMRFHLHEWQG